MCENIGLYHGKREDNGEWLEGYLYVCQDGTCDIAAYSAKYDTERFGHEVIPKTVGQFTRITDKNDKKIFEGDIILYRNVPCVVKYNVQNASYTLYAYGTLEISGFNANTMKFAEIIGNIYDNPELLSHN